MKGLVLLSCLLLLFPASGQSQGSPIPPGIRQADKAEAQTEKNIPPPMTQRAHTDYAKARDEAAELSKLAETIPADVDQAAKGLLSKDVIEKLKRIEKLSKSLRGQLNP